MAMIRARLLACCSLLAVACGTDRGPPVITVTGTVEFQDLEGGAWLIRAENGTLYNPRNLPAAFKVAGARVRVALIERRDLVGVQPGVIADIVSIEEASCADTACGVPYPPVTLHVMDSTSSAAIEGVVLENVSAPEPPPGSGGLHVGCVTGLTMTTCVVDAIAAGTYAFDVTAPGYETVHLVVEVPVHHHVPGICCESPWDPQTVDVAPSPIG